MKLSIVSLLGAAALVAGCTDDDLTSRQASYGDVIQFGASAAYESGSKESRTDYKDIVTIGDKQYVQIQWTPDHDIIDIAYPEAAQAKWVGYKVTGEQTKDGNNFIANMLEPMSSPGLQWGNPSAEDGKHHFYAVYPSNELLKNYENASVTMDKNGLTGYLPTGQDPVSTTGKDPSDASFTGKFIKPNMDFAYMVAKNDFTNRPAAIGLEFFPIVTALEFEMTVADANTGNTADITGISLVSTSGQRLCGEFNYKFDGGIVTVPANSSADFSRVSMTLHDVTLANGEAMRFTFFTLPIDIAEGDLQLQVFYTERTSSGSAISRVKTATIGKNVVAKKKYFYKGITFGIGQNATPSNWLSALDDNVLFRGLSIPVAGNAFSCDYNGTNPEYYKQQEKDFETLWNMGVRGFEFTTATNGAVSSANGTTSTESIAGAKFVCNGIEVGSYTFATAFETIEKKLNATPSEFAVIICRYQSHGANSATGAVDTGFNPQAYINQILNYLGGKTNKLIKLTPNTTVGQMRGKIAVIIRPADTDFLSYRGQDTTLNAVDGNNKSYSDYVTVVQDWGSAVDRWDRRYPGYGSQRAFGRSATNGYIEDQLWAASSNSETFTVTRNHDFGTFPAVELNPNFVYSISGQSDFSAKIVNMTRVIPESLNNVALPTGIEDYYKGLGTYYGGDYLWVKWPESKSVKLSLINTLLGQSMNSISNADNSIFINVLSGFYATKDLLESFLPYAGEYKCHQRLGSAYYTFKCENAGAGGDWKSCANDMNTAFKTKLTDLSAAGKEGPYGIVMMDYIGVDNCEASKDLPGMILMNNFKFPLPKATAGRSISVPLSSEKVDSSRPID